MPTETGSGWSPTEYIALASIASTILATAGTAFVSWLQHQGTLTHQKAEVLRSQVRDAMSLVAAIEQKTTESIMTLLTERIRLEKFVPQLSFENGRPPADPPMEDPWREPERSRLKYGAALKALGEAVDALETYIAIQGVFLPERIEKALQGVHAVAVENLSTVWAYEHVFITNFWRSDEDPFSAFTPLPERCNIQQLLKMTPQDLNNAFYRSRSGLDTSLVPLRNVMREYLGMNLDSRPGGLRRWGKTKKGPLSS